MFPRVLSLFVITHSPLPQCSPARAALW